MRALEGNGAALGSDGLPAGLTDDANTAELDGGDSIVLPYRGPQGIRPGRRADGRPMVLYRTEMVDRLIRYFLGPRRNALEVGWRRAGSFMPMIRRVLREEGVPEELAYLVAVESNFNPRARSPKHAVGLWQLTAPTARAFGLRIHRPWYDERLDPEASTHAAARLLAYLYDRYENWELVLAAYNAGEARVNAAIGQARRQGGPTDYWSLNLPDQTRGFVPSFLALAAIMSDPRAHGLESVERDQPLYSEGMQLELAATLDELAERVQVPVQELHARNLAWRSGFIPPLELGPVLLRLPPGRKGRLLASLATNPPVPANFWVHAVQEGETISHIADRYRVPTRDVLALNTLEWNSPVRVGQPVMIPVAVRQGQAVAVLESPPQGTDATPPAQARLHRHRVRNGDSLWSVAQHYGVQMSDLRQWNGLAGMVLQPGEELRVFLPVDWTTAR